MTIKEIEARSGMTRANIRFYETEGLLSPHRSENGYRDYSEEDLNILLRIKLLRTLDISLEEIKAIHNKEHNLEVALEKHLKKLETEKRHLEQSQNVCRIMRDDHVRYETLNAQFYMDAMQKNKETPVYDMKVDVIPKVRAPWRRYFARTLDFLIYSTIWNVILILVFRVNINNRGILWDFFDVIISMIMMVLIESVLLSKFGTTIGKSIFGLHITDFGGDKLSYKEASYRTKMVLWKGLGLQIPFYSWYRLWNSYSTLMYESTALEWEDESEITLRDTKVWRIFVCTGTHLLLFAILLLSVALAEMPTYRGDITVAEFCANYNQFASYYNMEGNSKLDSEGKWRTEAYQYVEMHDSDPEFIFTEENGVMTGMSFAMETQNDLFSVDSFRDEMAVATLAFMKAQEECGLFDTEVNDIVNIILANPYQDYAYLEHGVIVKCDVEYSGYEYVESYGTLVPEDGAETSYNLKFTMEKQGVH